MLYQLSYEDPSDWEQFISYEIYTSKLLGYVSSKSLAKSIVSNFSAPLLATRLLTGIAKIRLLVLYYFGLILQYSIENRFIIWLQWITRISLAMKTWYLHMWRYQWRRLCHPVRWTNLNLFLNDRNIFGECSEIFRQPWVILVLLLKFSISHSFVALTREISSWTLDWPNSGYPYLRPGM